MLKAADLYLKLKTIEDRIQNSTSSDGKCHFDAEKVYILLETALSYLPDSVILQNPQSKT